MELEKAIQRINEIKKEYGSMDALKEYVEAIEFILNHLTKQGKMIELMAEYIKDLDIDEDICTKNIINPQLCNEEYSNCEECIKQYFEKKVEEKINDRR